MPRALSPRPRLDLLESASSYELFAEVPGAASEAVDVQFRAGILHVDVQLGPAEAAPGNRLADADPRRLWRISVGFGDLVSGVDIRAIQADGVLHVHLPKSPDAPAGDDAPARFDPHDDADASNAPDPRDDTDPDDRADDSSDFGPGFDPDPGASN